MRQILNQVYKNLKGLILSVVLGMVISGVLATPAQATNLYQMPNVSAGEPTWVIDQAEVLSRLSEGKLSKNLQDLADKMNQEVRLVTVRRLDYGETAASFAQALFKKWYPTPEAQANQTLLLINTLTNNTAIVTGTEVQSIMSEDIAESVASETMMAPLRNGNKYNQSFLDASDRLIAVLSGQPDPGPPVIEETVQVAGTFTKAEDTDTKNSTIWVVVLLVVATVVPMATYFFYQGFSG